ncbi:MFS transporter [Dietzia sp.]|uniref:MFS transporter n=1 Tax=Dietzia sp. TaxID=1871616 RepID=UPI002FD88C3C
MDAIRRSEAMAKATAAGEVKAAHWGMLAISTVAASAASSFLVGVSFLIPRLHDDGVSLTAAGFLAAAPNIGVACALVAWGLLVDRKGERLSLTAGACSSAVLIALAMVLGASGGTSGSALFGLGVLFALAGAASAAANSASGRVVVGWFPPRRRGLAMGIRQMSQPAGVAVAALLIPPIADRAGVVAALGVPFAMAALSALLCWLFVVDPPRPAKGDAGSAELGATPYKVPYLWRIHATSVLLVVPQTLMQSWLLVWLVVGEGWSGFAGGVVVTATQILGGIGRIVVGGASDRVRHRNHLLRAVAVAAAFGFGALTAIVAFGAPGAVAVSVAIIASVISVADNGLAFTSVAEYAGPFWSGRALGVQNTAQFLSIAAITPVFAAIISGHGFVWAFALATLAGIGAVPLVPGHDEVRAGQKDADGGPGGEHETEHGNEQGAKHETGHAAK